MPADIRASKWADEYGRLIVDGADHGKWTCMPPQVAMLDTFSEPRIHRADCIKSARIGWTQVMSQGIAYGIAHRPRSMLMVQPTVEDAKGFSLETLDPMVENIPKLKERVAPPKSRNSGNTQQRKTYTGGILHLVGANSGRGFRRISTPFMFFDEISAYPPTVGDEGDQIALGLKRADWFADWFAMLGSTPTLEGLCRISREIRHADLGFYLVHCPECGIEQVLRFGVDSLLADDGPWTLRGEPLPAAVLVWNDDDPSTAQYACEACDYRWGENQHRDVIAGGFWRGERWEHRGDGFTFEEGFTGHIGFKIWAGYSYSPGARPRAIVGRYLEAKEDSEKLQGFVNLDLGEVYVEKGESVSPDRLIQRCEDWTHEVPERVGVLTAMVDVQGNRFEVEIAGWGRGEESWSIETHILPGNPTREEDWPQVFDVLEGEWLSASGEIMTLSTAIIDCGYLQNTTIGHIAKSGLGWIYPGKGAPGMRPVVQTIRQRAEGLRRRRSGMRPEIVGVDEAKSIILKRLALPDRSGPGVMHHPVGRDREYFEQLCSEKLVIRSVKGRPQRTFVKTRARNEALDLAVGNLAALRIFLRQSRRRLDDLCPEPESLGPASPPRALRPASPPTSATGRSDPFAPLGADHEMLS